MILYIKYYYAHSLHTLETLLRFENVCSIKDRHEKISHRLGKNEKISHGLGKNICKTCIFTF